MRGDKRRATTDEGPSGANQKTCAGQSPLFENDAMATTDKSTRLALVAYVLKISLQCFSIP